MSIALYNNSIIINRPYYDGPRLLADIGGTNARFALEYAAGDIRDIRSYIGAQYKDLSSVISRYFIDIGVTIVRHAVIAIANPVVGDIVKMTNHNWSFSIKKLRKSLGFDTFLVVNDFAALATAVPQLNKDELRQIGGGIAQSRQVIAVLGAGTGLGVAGVVPIFNNKKNINNTNIHNWMALSSEGGHVSFAPQDVREDMILSFVRRRWKHVSYERLASGPGLEIIYEALCERDNIFPEKGLNAAMIGKRAQIGQKLECETIDIFCGILGNFAGSVALTLCALGGIYIGGGIVPKLGSYFDNSRFRSCFENKGRFGNYLEKIPTFVITSKYPAFSGAAILLYEYLLSK